MRSLHITQVHAVKEFIVSIMQLNTGKTYEVNIKTAVLTD